MEVSLVIFNNLNEIKLIDAFNEGSLIYFCRVRNLIPEIYYIGYRIRLESTQEDACKSHAKTYLKYHDIFYSTEKKKVSIMRNLICLENEN